MDGSLLIRAPKTFGYWWTFVPVIPAGRDDPTYLALKRQWADHTMNCVARRDGEWKLTSSRGFYVESREDHIATILFHIWAAFPNVTWVGPLLDLWSIPHGEVKRVRWSYSWEEKVDRSARPDITDIVLNWEDQHGQAVLVVEAKRPGGKLSDKDRNGGVRYLNLPSIRPYDRRFIAYLVDEGDRFSAIANLPVGTPVTTWQKLGQLQAALIAGYEVPATLLRLQLYVAKHYADLGMSLDEKLLRNLDTESFTGTRDRYDAVTGTGLAPLLERFLVGSEVAFCARTGRMPEAPYPWLEEEPSLPEVVATKQQTTKERGIPIWRLPSAK